MKEHELNEPFIIKMTPPLVEPKLYIEPFRRDKAGRMPSKFGKFKAKNRNR